MTEADLTDIHMFMVEEVEKKGGKITQCYYAPELKDSPNSSRKPSPVMALKAKNDFTSVDFNKAIMIGDTDSDILFGKALNMKTVRVKTVEKIGVEADLTVNSLFDFAQLI